MALALLAALFAGCSQGSDGSVEVDYTTGGVTGSLVVKGFVLTPAVQPISGAQVVLDDGAAKVTTDAGGSFQFEHVAEGAHRIMVTATGYEANSLEIVAEPRMKSLRVILSPEASDEPRVVPYEFQGRIECGIQILNPAKGGCFPLLFGDVYWARWNLDAQPHWVQTDMVWENTQQLGQDLWIQYDCISGEPCPEDSLEITSTSGPSPLTLFMEPSLIERWKIGNPQDLSVRVFPASDTEPVMVVLQQDFTHYTHVFYNISPPAGWNFPDHGAPPT